MEHPLAARVARENALVIEADVEYGPAFLVEPFARPGVPLVWLWLRPEDAEDPIAMGNRFAEAVNRALGPSIPKGAPWPFGVNLLARYLKLLSPLDFAIFGVEIAPGLVGALLAMLKPENRILLQGRQVGPSLRPPAATVLTQEDLRLGVDDLARVAGDLPTGVLREVVARFEGKFEPILLELHQRGFLPPPLRPAPEGPEFLHETTFEGDPNVILDALMEYKRRKAALDLVIRPPPIRLPDALAGAVPLLFERGEHRKMLKRSQTLPEPHRKDERLLFWHLAAASRLEREHGLASVAEALLTENDPPAWSLFAPREILELLRPGAGLVLSFLGRADARLYGRPLSLRPSYAEILALLALHPDGYTLEELATHLGEGKNPSTIKAHLSRLRKRVPIATRPYRLEVPVRADFLDLKECLKRGKVRDAVYLYQGPLLPKSQSPRIEEERWALEEALRQAVLASHDGAALFALADRIGDDLELWEASLEHLHTTDPRRPIAKAHVRRLRREYEDSF